MGQLDLEREAPVGLRVTYLAGLYERYRAHEATVRERDQPTARTRELDQLGAMLARFV